MRTLDRFMTPLLLAAALFAFVSPARAQTAGRTPDTSQDEDVVRVNTDLVQTGVAVLDKEGRFVDGLKAGQFELTVDGRPQTISFFERVRAGSREEATLLGAARGNERPAPPATAPAVERGRTIVFFIDDYHLSLDSLARTRRMLTRFIEQEMTEQDLVAVATATGQVGFLQQFTDNKAVLRAAVERIVHRPYNVREMTRESTPMTEYTALAIERKEDPRVANFYIDRCMENVPPRYPRRSCEVEVINRARLILLQAAMVVANTYDSLRSLMRSTAQMPGRKLVFFVSDGFLLDTGPRNAEPRGKLHEVIDAAQAAGVVVYTIDARGLISGQLDATNNIPFDPNGRLASILLRDIPASQDALHALAEDTGGRALRNQNFFEPWLRKVLDETADYYLLAWRPADARQAAEGFHNLKVTVVGRPDLTVRLPRGFLRKNVAGASAVKAKAGTDATTKTPPQALRDALTAPNPVGGVPTSLSLVYLDTPGHGTVLTASTQVAEEGLTFAESEGKRAAVVAVAGVILNDKGKQAGSFQTRLSIDARDAQAGAPRGSETIYNYRQALAPGLYQVRVAARDQGSGQVGSAAQWIEIPDLSARRLALSSLLVGLREVGAHAQAQFSVDHRFARGSRLGFMLFVYNAARGAKAGGAPAALTLEARLLRGGKAVLTTRPRALAAGGETDGARLPFAGELSLASLPAGRYVLEVTATDPASGATDAQRTHVTIE